MPVMALVSCSSNAALLFGGTESIDQSVFGGPPPRIRGGAAGFERAVCEALGVFMNPPMVGDNVMSGRVGDDVLLITGGAGGFIEPEPEAIISLVSLVKTVCLIMLATRVKVMVFTNASRRFKPCGVGLSSSQSSGPRTFNKAPAAQTWVWTSVLWSSLMSDLMASLSRMRRRLATSRETFCNAPAAEPHTHGWVWCRRRTSHRMPPLRRITRMESTSELMLCRAPTARALT